MKLTVLDRVTVRSIRPALLDRLHDNDPDLVAELLSDPVVQRRNRVALDWDDAWRLDTGGEDDRSGDRVDVWVAFAARIPVRPARVIAEGCRLPRAEVERLIHTGEIVSAVRLTSTWSSSFTFTLKRRTVAEGRPDQR